MLQRTKSSLMVLDSTMQQTFKKLYQGSYNTQNNFEKEVQRRIILPDFNAYYKTSATKTVQS
jgi:hypothetical protein